VVKFVFWEALVPTPGEGLNPSDVFHVIGYTAQTVASGSMIHLMGLSTHVLKSNEALWKQLGPLVPATQAGKAKRQIFEIYSITPFLFDSEDHLPAAIRRLGGGPYVAVEFFNDVALNPCGEYHIQLPPVIGKVTRAELPPPPHLGITTRGVSYKRA
jgi:hypothetical protein